MIGSSRELLARSPYVGLIPAPSLPATLPSPHLVLAACHAASAAATRPCTSPVSRSSTATTASATMSATRPPSHSTTTCVPNPPLQRVVARSPWTRACHATKQEMKAVHMGMQQLFAAHGRVLAKQANKHQKLPAHWVSSVQPRRGNMQPIRQIWSYQ